KSMDSESATVGADGACGGSVTSGCPEGSAIFFFPAGDGIRVRNVTGVQTCALPISAQSPSRCAGGRREGLCAVGEVVGPAAPAEIGRASCRERVETSPEDAQEHQKGRQA